MIYVDLDGTVFDTVTAFCKWYNIPTNFTWPKGEYNFTKVTGKPTDCFNDPLFWTLLEPYWSALSIMQMVQYYADRLHTNWTFITLMPDIAHCSQIKSKICIKYFDRAPVILDFPAQKASIVENNNDILIDDNLDEILAWPNPNHRILVPRPWNIADGKDTDAVEIGLTRIYTEPRYGD